MDGRWVAGNGVGDKTQHPSPPWTGRGSRGGVMTPTLTIDDGRWVAGNGVGDGAGLDDGGLDDGRWVPGNGAGVCFGRGGRAERPALRPELGGGGWWWGGRGRLEAGGWGRGR